MRRRRRTAAGLLVIVLAAAGYTTACALAPLPDPTVELTAPTEREMVADTADAQAAVDSRELPTAIGWADGTEVFTNDHNSYSLGSVTKLITILICMEAEPLEPGSDGRTYVWTQEDRDLQDYYLSLEGVAYPIPVGTRITQRQMLEFIFLPSSNDYAHAYAMMTFGDLDAFEAAAQEFLQKHELTETTIVEPTGMDSENASSPGDLVRVARLALQNPTIREFNGMQYADMPWGVGRIENTNPLLGKMPGIIGVKTGMLSTVGYNLIAAQEISPFDREVISISVTMARPSKDERARSGESMLLDMQSLPAKQNVIADGETLGTITTITGQEIPIVTAGSADTVMLPGEKTTVTLALDTGELVRGARGTEVAGRIVVATPSGEATVPVVATEEIAEPDLWWRLTHPAQVFGWA